MGTVAGVLVGKVTEGPFQVRQISLGQISQVRMANGRMGKSFLDKSSRVRLAGSVHVGWGISYGRYL